MTNRPDWLAALADPGRIEVTELLHPDSWSRSLAADHGAELELATASLRGEQIQVIGSWKRRSARSADDVLVDLDLSGDPQPAGGFRKVLWLGGTAGSVEMHTDETRPSRLRGALRYLRLEVGDQRWVWHFEGGKAAGERLVLARGERPGAASAVVTTYPASHGRHLGNPRGGATADTHVTTWDAGASALEVALVELLAVSRMDGLVDYRPARIAEGFSELLDVAPRPDANTE
jgi:hypothetical protein